MIVRELKFIVCALLFFIPSFLPGMIYDNRYFPLIQKPWITIEGRNSHIAFDGYATTAHRGFAPGQEVGIPEIFGPFDEAQLGASLAAVGKVNPLTPLAAASEIPWRLNGKIQSQGVALWYEQYFTHQFYMGLYALAMRVNSSIDFSLVQGAATTAPINGPGDILAFDDARRQMLQELNLTCDHVQQHGFGDVELYLRWSDYWKYIFKLRTLRMGARVGTLIPTGVKRNIYEPASVPFGGNGHWGVYGSADAELEVKEDWKIGVWARVSKRFARTSLQRMPHAKEQELFGVVIGQAKVNPGYTGIFSWYFQMENLREGFGLRAQYTMVAHQQDNWHDERADKTVSVNLAEVIGNSGWGAEYITVTAFYDFEKMNVCRGYTPIIVAALDVPVQWLVGNRFVKTFKVSLGLEFNF